MERFSEQLSRTLEPLAAWFRSLSMPDPIVHWGHPVMMGIVLFVMGGYVGWTGWQARLRAKQSEDSQPQRTAHRQVAPLMFAFIAMGYTGGILSLVMQKQPLLSSPHFWTGTAIIGLLASNGLLAAMKFGQGGTLRTVHAYLGSVALGVFVVHAVLGVRLGLSI
ncbi:DUF4079 domain-containing protein [Lyngbya confervoides]|uniref:DUF4079 domain-containing protein n=1 Tax=Lyngbya confervoides BDU141951 TaxID=1574623 RepID=A0ABD4TAL6_9CYAN|nr:DUF4079 domain-containing protein [Lyngbya confervoides]MCM1985165.1 DUF4079 domain-containing protein [Lyngbya confervoides BDU141951]